MLELLIPKDVQPAPLTLPILGSFCGSDGLNRACIASIKRGIEDNYPNGLDAFLDYYSTSEALLDFQISQSFEMFKVNLRRFFDWNIVITGRFGRSKSYLITKSVTSLSVVPQLLTSRQAAGGRMARCIIRRDQDHG